MSEPVDRTIARLVGGRYRVTGLIASGGMGEVYRAHDEVLDRTVALKVLRSNLGADADFSERFRREAMNAARLSHPSIVQVYDFGRDESDAYMAMEFVDGQNLREILTAHGPLAPANAARVAYHVCTALEHARRGGIVHRDIKPENILITADGGVKVADFGLARALAESRATQAGMVLGTAAYLAPEQIQGMTVDHRADVYALGCVLYEMLTGAPPFGGDNPAAIAYRRVNEDVPMPGTVVPSTPPALDEVVARACARAANERYPTAADMAGALRAAFPDVATAVADLDVHQTTAIPIASVDTVVLERTPKRSPAQVRRRRIVTILAVVALLAISIPLAVRAVAKVTVPSVAGLTDVEAKEKLAALGFDVNVDPRSSDTVPEGRVIGTEPAVGARLKKGADVTLLVSSGPAITQVPDVTGKPFADAERTLTQAGLRVRRVDAFDAAKKGLVFKIEPGAQVVVRKGSTVTVHVSKGPELIVVPDVRNRKQEDAKNALEAAGFTVSITMKEDATVPEGFVISQSPAQGQKAPKGSAIAIVVSKGTPLAAVPNLRCMTKRQAEDALAAAGFKGEFRGSGRYVVDQDPPPETQAHKGSTVTAFMGSGVFLGCS